jgi:hypothetical protein
VPLNLLFFFKKKSRARGVAYTVMHLVSKHEALSSNPSSGKKKSK